MNPFKPLKIISHGVQLTKDNVREVIEFMSPHVDDIFQTVNGDWDMVLCFRNDGEEDYKIAGVGDLIIMNCSDEPDLGFRVVYVAEEDSSHAETN